MSYILSWWPDFFDTLAMNNSPKVGDPDTDQAMLYISRILSLTDRCLTWPKAEETETTTEFNGHSHADGRKQKTEYEEMLALAWISSIGYSSCFSDPPELVNFLRKLYIQKQDDFFILWSESMWFTYGDILYYITSDFTQRKQEFLQSLQYLSDNSWRSYVVREFQRDYNKELSELRIMSSPKSL